MSQSKEVPSKKFNPWDWRKDYYFDRVTARRVIRFCTERLKHVKGELAGTYFIPEQWQRRILRRLFGWKKRSDGTRKFRTLFLFIPRKNGKSFLGAAIALYLLHADGEIGAEIISCAAETEQANFLFAVAKDMNSGDEILSQRAKSFKRSIACYETGSSYKVITAEADSKHGANLHGILFDELHAQPNRDLYDVLRTSTGGRRQPLEIYMTTAGFDRLSICYEVYDYAKRVLSGDIDDPSFMPVIYEADIDDDWRLESTWKKANPNYNISVYKDYFELKVKEAIAQPTNENTFRRLNLNIWTESDVRAINMLKWRECGLLNYNLQEFAGKTCYLGLDLSSSNDLAAAALIFRINNMWAALMKFWCPQDKIAEREKETRTPWRHWVQQGFITATQGGRIDYGRIRADINDLHSVYDIREIAVDPWNAHQISEELEKSDGFTVVHVRQGIYTLNAPTKEFIASIADVKFAHGNNPVLTWNAGNLSTEEDASGNLRPSKKRSPEKIDGCVAVITGLSRAILNIESESVYATRGVLAF